MSDETGLTIKQVARELDVDEKTVRRWIKAGQLKAEQNFVGRYTILRADLDTFVEERKQRRNQ